MEFEIRTADTAEREEIKRHMLEFLKEGTAGQIDLGRLRVDNLLQTMGKMYDSGINILVATANNKWIGYIVYNTDRKDIYTGEREGFILELYVMPSYRRNGIAKALTNACIDRLRTIGIKAIALNVFSDNRKAKMLYESLGFREFTAIMKNSIL